MMQMSDGSQQSSGTENVLRIKLVAQGVVSRTYTVFQRNPKSQRTPEGSSQNPQGGTPLDANTGLVNWTSLDLSNTCTVGENPRITYPRQPHPNDADDGSQQSSRHRKCTSGRTVAQDSPSSDVSKSPM